MSSVSDIVLVTLGAFAAGIVNTAAAGGGLISFLALVATGMPPLAANVTSTFATPLAFAGVLWPRAFGRERQAAMRESLRETRPLLAAATTGTVGGVALLWLISEKWFAWMAAPLVALAALLLLAHRVVEPRLERWRAGRDRSSRGWLVAVGVYAGFFGSGVGVLALVAVSLATGWSLKKSNVAKAVVLLGMSIVAAVALVPTGLIAFAPAAWMVGPMLLGGLIGLRIAKRLPDLVVRISVASVAVLGIARLVAG